MQQDPNERDQTPSSRILGEKGGMEESDYLRRLLMRRRSWGRMRKKKRERRGERRGCLER